MHRGPMKFCSGPRPYKTEPDTEAKSQIAENFPSGVGESGGVHRSGGVRSCGSIPKAPPNASPSRVETRTRLAQAARLRFCPVQRAGRGILVRARRCRGRRGASLQMRRRSHRLSGGASFSVLLSLSHGACSRSKRIKRWYPCAVGSHPRGPPVAPQGVRLRRREVLAERLNPTQPILDTLGPTRRSRTSPHIGRTAPT